MLANPTTPVKTLTILGHTAPVATWLRAFERARAEGVKVYRMDGEWYATSVSHKGQRHHVNASCDCEAARRGLLCKHIAAVLAARIRLGELARCETCGRVAEVGTAIVTTTEWLGGHGLVEHTHCLDGGACWHRWDEQHRLNA